MKIRDLIKEFNRRSYVFNFLMGIIKIGVGLFIHLYSFCISAMYNLMLGLSKYKTKRAKSKNVGIFIILASILYVLYSVYIIRYHINAQYNMYTGILIAAITFIDIGIAVYGIIKAKKNRDFRSKIEKQLNLCSAIISLSLTQQALLSFTNVGKDVSLFVGVGGIVFSSVAIIIGIFIQVSIFKNKD